MISTKYKVNMMNYIKWNKSMTLLHRCRTALGLYEAQICLTRQAASLIDDRNHWFLFRIKDSASLIRMLLCDWIHIHGWVILWFAHFKRKRLKLALDHLTTCSDFTRFATVSLSPRKNQVAFQNHFTSCFILTICIICSNLPSIRRHHRQRRVLGWINTSMLSVSHVVLILLLCLNTQKCLLRLR